MSSDDNQIKIADVLAPVISSRDSIASLRKAAEQNPSKKVNLSFANVDFVSRSAAHEILVMKEDLARKVLNKKEVSFVDMKPEVKEMFRLVAANRAAPKHEKAKKFEAEQVDINELVHNSQF